MQYSHFDNDSPWSLVFLCIQRGGGLSECSEVMWPGGGSCQGCLWPAAVFPAEGPVRAHPIANTDVRGKKKIETRKENF